MEEKEIIEAPENQENTEPKENINPEPKIETKANTEAKSDELWGMTEVNFLTFLHLSQFAGYIIPGIGYAAPIVMWVMHKDKNEKVNEQGKHIVNWIISAAIYGFVSFILSFILIGFLFLFVLGIAITVFPIIGAIKANKGEIWKYPLSIPFIK